MPRLREDKTAIPLDRDASMKRALLRLTHENQRLKALVVSLSELVIKNVVTANPDKDKLVSKDLD